MRLLITVFVLTGALAAQEQKRPESPKAAWEGITLAGARMQPVGASVAVDSMKKKKAAAYLTAWEAAGAEPNPEERLYLARLMVLAGRTADALLAFEHVALDERSDAAARNQARADWANELGRRFRALTPVQLAAARKTLDTVLAKPAKEIDDVAHSQLHRTRAVLAYASNDTEAARTALKEMVRVRPKMAHEAARQLVPILMAGVWKMEDYPGVRERGVRECRRLLELRDAQIPQGGRPLPAGMVERMLQRLVAPLKMLGEPLPVWEPVHDLGGPKTLKELEGKVVVLYTWRTEVNDSIRGLAAMRDLAKRQADTETVIVGITFSGRRVFASRYEFDEDFEAKDTTPETAALQWGERDPKKIAAFAEAEKKALAEFIKNHQMNWTNVMLDAKKARSIFGVPSILLLDRKGRVRYVKRGAFRRGEPVATQEIPSILDHLLAEE